MNTSQEQMNAGRQGRPKLAIRRPVQAAQDREHMNAAAEAVDARVRKAERRQRIARLKKSLGNFVSIVALLALLAVGYVVWKSVQKKEMPVRLPDSVTQMISNAVEKVNAEIAK